VAVVEVRGLHVPVLQPLLELAACADLVGCKPCPCGSELPAEVRIHAEDPGGLDAHAEQVPEDLAVHGRPCAHAGITEGVLVLGRQGRAGHQPLVRGLLDKGVQEELRSAPHGRIGLCQEGLVLTEQVVLPQVHAQPCTAQGPHPVLGPVDRGRGPPQVCVVVGDPPPGPVLDLGRAGPGLGELGDHPDQGLRALGQVGRLRGPVVHLCVDVDRVLAAPGRAHLVVPEALEVGRLGARAGAGDQEVPAELEVQGSQVRVLSRGKGLDPFVRGLVHGSACAQVQGHPAEQTPVLRHMVGQQGTEGLPARPGDRLPGRGLRIAPHVPETPEARGCCDQQGGGVRPSDPDRIGVRNRVAPLGLDPDPCLEPEGPCNALGLAVDPLQDQGVLRVDPHCGPLRRAQACDKGDLARPVSGQVDHDDLVHRAGEDLACVAHTRCRVRDRGHGGVQVQVAAIVLDRIHVREGQEQVAHGLVLHLAHGPGQHAVLNDLVGLLVSAVEDQPAGLGQGRQGLGVGRIIRPACPQRVLVEMQTLLDDPPVDHGPKPAVAHGQGLGPNPAGPAVPQAQGLLRGLGLTHEPAGKRGDRRDACRCGVCMLGRHQHQPQTGHDHKTLCPDRQHDGPRLRP